MAIKDPAPLLWTGYTTPEAPRVGRENKHLTHAFCKYQLRYNFPCNTNRYDCKYCYMKQQSLYSTEVIHICDVCGREFTGADKMAYVTVDNRYGGLLDKAEMCEDCSMMLLTWLKGEQLPEDYQLDADPVLPKPVYLSPKERKAKERAQKKAELERQKAKRAALREAKGLPPKKRPAKKRIHKSNRVAPDK